MMDIHEWNSLRGTNEILVKKEIISACDFAIVILLFDHRHPHNDESDFDFTVQLYPPKENRNWMESSVQGSWVESYKVLSDDEFNVDEIKKFIAGNKQSLSSNFREVISNYFHSKGAFL